MNLYNIWHIIKKEILSLLRNKRVLIGLFSPLILMPFLFLGYNQFVEMAQRQSESELSRIIVVGDLPSSILADLQQDDRFEWDTAPEFDASENWADDADLVLVYRNTADVHVIRLYYDSGRNAGTRAYDRLLPLLEDFKQQELHDYLQQQNLPVNLASPITISLMDQATAKEVSRYSLSNIVPLILTLFSLLSVLNFSVELTTAEKETGTLETLFSIPVTKSEIVTAKLLTCLLLGLGTMLMSLSALVVLMPLLMDLQSLGLEIDLFTGLILFVTLIPMVFIGAGLSIAVGMFANSYKESGAYLSPLMFVFMIPAYIGMTPGIEINAGYSLIPILNATLLIKSALMHTVNYSYFAIVLVTNGLFSIISLTLMVKVFGTERILFGTQDGSSFRLDRRAIRPKDYLKTDDVMMGLALIVVLYIYLSTILSAHLSVVTSMIATQYIGFAFVPVVMIWYLKADIKKTLGLASFSLKDMAGGILLWISALSLSMVYQLIIAPYVSSAPTLVELENLMSQLSWPLLFFIVAVTPALCEEITFRGFALMSLHKKIGPLGSVIVTALIFSIVHLDFIRLVPTFLLGLAFGVTAMKTQSVFPGMLLHLANNSFALFFTQESLLQYPVLIPVAIISLIGGYALLCR